MRSRTVLSVVAVLGALGVLALSADMYRRIVDAELSGKASQSALAGTQIFGMVHVIGAAALGVLLLAIALLILNESTSGDASEKVLAQPVKEAPVSPSIAPPADAQAFDPSLSQPLPADRTGLLLSSGLAAATADIPLSEAPTASGRSLPPAPSSQGVSNRPSIVAVSPAPESAEAEPKLAEPLELSGTELNRAVDYERVWREQKGDVPTMIPLPPESAQMPAVEAPKDEPKKSPDIPSE